MKRYLLDTNVISETRKPKPHGGVKTWIEGLQPEQIFLSAVTIGELQAGLEITRHQGAAKAREIERWVDDLCFTINILAMDGLSFREWARLRIGKSNNLNEDAMIAATAKIHHLIVATRNERDFSQFDVEIFNPFQS